MAASIALVCLVWNIKHNSFYCLRHTFVIKYGTAHTQMYTLTQLQIILIGKYPLHCKRWLPYLLGNNFPWNPHLSFASVNTWEILYLTDHFTSLKMNVHESMKIPIIACIYSVPRCLSVVCHCVAKTPKNGCNNLPAVFMKLYMDFTTHFMTCIYKCK